VLHRDVAVHIIECDDDRAPLLRHAARTSATVLDRRMLRVLDIDEADERCFVVNEWGSGTSLDILLADAGPLSPTVAAWIVSEAADTVSLAHEAGVAHGRLVPENVLIATDGSVRLIGFAVDAALHGLPEGTVGADIADLAGLLYAALTGKWAGPSPSAVPVAPSSHGHVLRPRQVRAGIPRSLDALCDHVLNHGGEAEVSAAMLADALLVFLGPSATAAEAWLARIEHPRRGEGPVVLPPVPDPPVREATHAHRESQPADESGQPQPDQPEPEQATQAGMPIFHEDTDEVSWLARHAEKPPPPPEFEPTPERPLFAPEPAQGEPVRRPRVAPATQVSGGGGFWPWESTNAGSVTGSGVLPAFVDDDETDEHRHPPGTSMLRLAGIIAACLLVLVAVVVAFNLGRGKTPLGASQDASTKQPTQSGSTQSGSPSAAPITAAKVRDFDPQGNGEENADEAPRAVDGDPATAWTTVRYDQQLGPAGLKTGVGLVLDLGAAHVVSQVELTTVGSPTSVSVYVTDADPTSLTGLSVAGSAVVTGTHTTLALDQPQHGRYVVVWLTKLPAVSGGFRGGVAEVVVKGD
jgi:hypothetical protein